MFLKGVVLAPKSMVVVPGSNEVLIATLVRFDNSRFAANPPDVVTQLGTFPFTCSVCPAVPIPNLASCPPDPRKYMSPVLSEPRLIIGEFITGESRTVEVKVLFNRVWIAFTPTNVSLNPKSGIVIVLVEDGVLKDSIVWLLVPIVIWFDGEESTNEERTGFGDRPMVVA